MINQQFQVSSTTEPDRYPDIFRHAAKLRPDAETVLSFGCSSGEEVASLANYFPVSKITGTDIKPGMVKLAREKYPQYDFLSPDQIGERQFDVVFAMSVLCRWPDTDGYMPYDLFEEGCQAVDALLAPGGLLVAHNTTYDVTSAMPHMVPIDAQVKRGRVTARNIDGSPRPSFPHALFEKPV